MTDVANKVTTTYIVETRDAIAQTQRLADAQQKGAKQASKAMDDFQRDAERALGKVERDIQKQEKAWDRTLKKMNEGPGLFGKVEGAIKGFNSTVSLAVMGLGALPKALEVASAGVDLLKKAWGGLADAFGTRPELRMMWEESPHKRWIEMFNEKTKAQKEWADSLRVEFFGADVDSEESLARRRASRAEVLRQQKQAEDADQLRRDARLAAQNADVQRQYEESAARAAANREREKRARLGGGGPVPDFANGWGARLDDAREWLWRANGADPMLAKILGADYQGDSGFSGGFNFDPALQDSRGDAGSIAALGDLSGGYRGDGKFHALTDSRSSSDKFLEKIFGPPEEFDAYTTAWSTLETAVTSGYEALITGSESAGAAIKKVIASSIMAEGSRMLVMALREGAMAVAALATGNFASAAAHGKSALMFGAGATAAGIAASALGGGGAGSVGGTNPSTLPTGAATVRDREEGTRTHIIIGQGWQDEDTPRQRAHRFAKSAVNSAGYDTSPRGVVYQ